MGDSAKDTEGIKVANPPSGGELKLEMKGNDSSPNQLSSSSSSSSSPQVTIETVNKEEIDKYKIYGYNKSNDRIGVGDAESKRQRRMVKYNSYAVESKLKSSLMNWFHWSKNK
ncbi:hypothetical protein ERO13_D01G023532v2 [Gossypium hirsutum]|uniref:Uncharacterized protein n=2 Tax=Gossypium TaxID=3633 RepID=A0A5J5SJH0_GOSBA|nr:hypothetical protein ES319_D01G027700v1 [Gossypium barbadense]KAG4160881.1 hypothetical protein ERO13_D01G023532v2 [Gossypium hirsutum]TYG81793.1 hypothetical protein ES288_D01G034300v1 [Gossypium darwinii]